MRYKLADANDAARLRVRATGSSATGAEVERRLARSAPTIHKRRGGDRVRLPRHVRLRRRPEAARRLRRGRARRGGALARALARDHQGPRRRRAGRRAVPPGRLHRHARDRPRADGDRVRRRHLRRAPVLGLSLRRRRGRAQRPADELLPVEAPARALGPPLPVRVRLRDHRRLPRGEDERRATRSRTRCARASRSSTASSPTSASRSDALGVAKDEMAAKPLVLYEADDLVALASEEIAIRAIVDHEIDTYDPYEGEVMVWTALAASGRSRYDARGLVELGRDGAEGLRDRRRRRPCSTRRT